MDLHPIPNRAASVEEREAIEAVIESARFRREDSRHLLLPALRAVQSRVGWISPGALDAICRRLHVPPAEAYGVATFYSLLAVERRSSRVVHVCEDIACRVRGGRELRARLEKRFGQADSDDAGEVTWTHGPCLGMCERAPAALIQRAGFGDLTVAPASLSSVEEGIAGEAAPAPPVVSAPQTVAPRDPGLRLLRRVGQSDPESLSSYTSAGGYEALRRSLSMGSEAVIAAIETSGLMGRGGAAFPTGRKWRAVAAAPVQPHYLVCNADESEPGTFKDRILMEEDPFAVVEAMTIAGIATGCKQGFVYVRGEYPLAARRLETAIDKARVDGLLGEGVAGSDSMFDIEIRRGAGAYICGEETALFNSIEGFRGEPRNKPPFPTDVGLFGKPTLVNNVETLVNVLDIVLEGGEAFKAVGTEASSGTRLFCLSGCVRRPGLYEVPLGTPLRVLIEMAGGVEEDRSVRAVLLGGAAGTFLTPDELDLELSFEGTRAAGATLGSGAVMVFDDTVDMMDVLLRIAAFFRDESCGQCVPCRVGTVRQEEALHRFARNGTSGAASGTAPDDRVLLEELSRAMRDASICGLGQTAASAIQSAIERRGVFWPSNGGG